MNQLQITSHGTSSLSSIRTSLPFLGSHDQFSAQFTRSTRPRFDIKNGACMDPVGSSLLLMHNEGPHQRPQVLVTIQSRKAIPKKEVPQIGKQEPTQRDQQRASQLFPPTHLVIEAIKDFRLAKNQRMGLPCRTKPSSKSNVERQEESFTGHRLSMNYN